MKRVLIAGKGSYIGSSLMNYLSSRIDEYRIDELDTVGNQWMDFDFSRYDAVFQVAGIVHVKETDENKDLYYKVNCDLAIKIAEKAKNAGVRQFIYLSSMNVYGLECGEISRSTPVHPITHYGKSKVLAEEKLQGMETDAFRVVILRPPMVYGKGCKGNYQRLRKFALKSPVFPAYQNKRSMLYIGNLCAFVQKLIDEQASGLFFPQDKEYVCTMKMVDLISEAHGRRMLHVRIFNPLINNMSFSIFRKVFGTLIYTEPDSVNEFGIEEAIHSCEN